MFMRTFRWEGVDDRIAAGFPPSRRPAVRSLRRRTALAALPVAMIAVLAPVTAASADGPCGSGGAFSTSIGIATCTYSVSGLATFVVPNGVTSIDVVAAGAAGGQGGALGAAGGAGASVEALALPVTPGDSLTVRVGSRGGDGNFTGEGGAGGAPGGGAGGFSPYELSPGGGGGYSGLFRATSLPLVIGAGGGGGSGGGVFSRGGAGDTASGGATGGTSFGGGYGGGGAAGSVGGTGGAGVFGGQNGEGGMPLIGGAGGAGASTIGHGGGGGGGGYAGGGGGGGAGQSNAYFKFEPGGGGGGGSSYGITGLINGTAASAASVTIRWATTTSDTTAPTVTLTTPPEGATYVTGQAVTADYACADESGGSGLADCVGTVTNGSAIDTASIGAKSFTVSAHDNAGNQTTVTHHYQVAYPFAGFFRPVDNDTLNVLKAGQGVPVKLSLGGDRGLGILAIGSPTSRPVQCDTSMASDPVEQTVTAGASGLSYDPATTTYTYTWKTDKAWANTCRQLTVTLSDGTSHSALFKFTR